MKILGILFLIVRIVLVVIFLSQYMEADVQPLAIIIGLLYGAVEMLTATVISLTGTLNTLTSQVEMLIELTLGKDNADN